MDAKYADRRNVGRLVEREKRGYAERRKRDDGCE